MPISPLAGRPATKEMRVDPARLERDYYERRPDVADPGQGVSFGTSGHPGSPLRGTFTGETRGIAEKALAGSGR